jgi:hypothetical protein
LFHLESVATPPLARALQDGVPGAAADFLPRTKIRGARERGQAMQGECGTNPAAEDGFSRILHDHADELTAIGRRIAAFDACVAAALARRHAQAGKAPSKTGSKTA